MAWTAQDLVTIESAIASGTEEVRFADRSVRYRSITELQAARAEILNFLTSQSTAQPTRVVRTYTASGWGDC